MIHNDHLATPQKMTDASGVVVWSAGYKPFGEAVVTPSSTITNNLRFPGQYYDQETDLHDNYFRNYDPAIGRYKQADPIGIDRGENHLYVYVGNDPLNDTDPLGLSKRKENCDKLIARLEGILRHGGHHADPDNPQSQHENCAQIQRYKGAFISNNCSKYRPDLLDAIKAFEERNCNEKPKQCEQKQQSCVKQSKLVAVAIVGGYIIYKVVEVMFCPWLVPVTP